MAEPSCAQATDRPRRISRPTELRSSSPVACRAASDSGACTPRGSKRTPASSSSASRAPTSIGRARDPPAQPCVGGALGRGRLRSERCAVRSIARSSAAGPEASPTDLESVAVRQPGGRGARRHALSARRRRAPCVRAGASGAHRRATVKCASMASRVATGMRIVATAAALLDADVRENRFRADLYRRLGASRIDVPPAARSRRGRAGARRAAARGCARDGRAARRSRTPRLRCSAALSWPGNLAELRAVVERAAADAHRRHAFRSSTCCRRSTSSARRRRSRRPEACAKRVCVSSATTLPPSCSITAGAWPTPPRRWASSVPISIRKARQLGIPVARLAE